MKRHSYLQKSFFNLWQQAPVANFDATATDVERALNKTKLSLNDFATLLSPAATGYLEVMAQKARMLTRQRFGNNIAMFLPLYLSNLCANDCSYCGFSMSNSIKRKTLSMDEIIAECEAIKRQGYDTLLLVTGEHEKKVGIDYFRQVIPLVKRYFSYLMLEVQPLSKDEYAELKNLGLDAVLVYQETYHQNNYADSHIKGNKMDFRWRLETPDRLAQAGVDKIGLGCLLGLSPWQQDVFQLASHLNYMQTHYWKSRYSIALPRLKPCFGGANVNHPVDDKTLVQLICAFRIFAPDVEISLSTREHQTLRDNMLNIAVTHLSAGSSTQPGGYAVKEAQLEQFSTDDQRSAVLVAKQIQQSGMEVVWKDWQAFSKQ